MSTLVEYVCRPMVLFAAQVNKPLSSSCIACITRVVLTIENLPDDVICLPCRSQLTVGSGMPDAWHVISRRAPGSIVTRVPITTEIGFKSCICSTDDDETSIFGNVASTKQNVLILELFEKENIQDQIMLQGTYRRYFKFRLFIVNRHDWTNIIFTQAYFQQEIWSNSSYNHF